jgi:hypothetical protein
MYWHVRVKTQFDNFKRPDGSKTSECTFITEGARLCLRCMNDHCWHCARGAVRKTLLEAFGDIAVALAMIREDPEVWPANRLRVSAQ